jgi:hypothetical protein
VVSVPAQQPQTAMPEHQPPLMTRLTASSSKCITAAGFLFQMKSDRRCCRFCGSAFALSFDIIPRTSTQKPLALRVTQPFNLALSTTENRGRDEARPVLALLRPRPPQSRQTWSPASPQWGLIRATRLSRVSACGVAPNSASAADILGPRPWGLFFARPKGLNGVLKGDRCATSTI